MTTFLEYTAAKAACLSDEELVCELRCAERCALLSTRSRRDLALLRVRCLRRELERRSASAPTPQLSQTQTDVVR